MRDGLAARHPDSDVVFASKSFPCLAAYQLFAAEGLAIDIAGAGELVMALAAGVPPERIYQHGNAKTTAELAMALDAGVGCVVVDNFDDIDRPGTAGHPPAAGAGPDHPGDRPGHPRIAVHRRRRLQVRAAARPGARGDRPDPGQRPAAPGRTAPAHRIADPRYRAVRPGGGGGVRAGHVRRLRHRRRPRRPLYLRRRGPDRRGLPRHDRRGRGRVPAGRGQARRSSRAVRWSPARA